MPQRIIFPMMAPSKKYLQSFRAMPKKQLSPIDELEKEEIYKKTIDIGTLGKLGATGFYRVKEIDKEGKPHYFHFDPETFKKLQEFHNAVKIHSHVNPWKRMPKCPLH
jgi:hypothetical protein